MKFIWAENRIMALNLSHRSNTKYKKQQQSTKQTPTLTGLILVSVQVHPIH